MASEGGKAAIMAAFLANLGVAVTKLVAFLLTGFSSMLAESIHSVADTGNQLLLLLGSRRASREASLEHPFGYGQQRYVYSFLVAIMLFVLGGLFALYEAYEKVREALGEEDYDPFASRWWWVPLAVVLVAMVLEGSSLRTAVRASNRVRGRRSWLRFVRTTKSPELPVVLLEDFGALIGLTAAFLGIGLTVVTADPVWDGIGSGVIGVLLVVLAVFLAVEMGSLLVGEAATPELRGAILEALASPGAVDRVINSRTMHLGPDEILVAAKLAVGETDSALEITAAIDEAERAARACAPEVEMVIYLEPDLDHAPGSPNVDGPGVDPDPRESAVEDASHG
ncbi:cation diffusion facilitator family transporter [Phycicoccus endophyticus]|uniref:Cation diffusion facilitator family transporter n=1 Tax=Phycicoccus endophyticus TaxID=1690220 RepID=A0A7G9R352_9MICO|nr:cation diffusion facilitator family transporter [Phycicoccus endophyticus]NHI20322.1 cation diffusion facilitator family transporter [Phycicoccus endophyticus]QNN50027.1 cation diffusion facilitator family transporter [Phycicoccus endophyticus]GGL28767.1 putative cation transporter [Phycicoccus endophyticus]